MLKLDYVGRRGFSSAARAWERALEGHSRSSRPLRPSCAGLIVVDMQRFFLDSAGPAFIPCGPIVLPLVRDLIQAFRAAHRPTAYAVYATDPSSPMSRRWRRKCPKRSPWTALGQGLDARRGERIFVKSGYSAFRKTGLRAWLRSRGVSDVVVAGLMTNLCVEATVRDAFDGGFGVFVPLDGCASGSEDVHLGSLKTMACGFASVVPCANICSNLMKGAGSK